MAAYEQSNTRNWLFIIIVVVSALPCAVLTAQQSSIKQAPDSRRGGSFDNNYRISNAFLTVNYDPATKSLEATTKPSGKTFLRNIIPDGVVVSAGREQVNSAVFGQGSALDITTADGGSISFTLYPLQPFLFVKQSIKNAGKELVDIPKLSPVFFSVDLGKPAIRLKTLGTGGLLDPDKSVEGRVEKRCAFRNQ